MTDTLYQPGILDAVPPVARYVNFVIPDASANAQSIKDALDPKPKRRKDDPTFVKYIPFDGDPPTRRVVLAWRRSFTRYEAIAALRNAIYACELPGVKRLS